MYMPRPPPIIVKKNPPIPQSYPPCTVPRPNPPLVERSMSCNYCIEEMILCHEGRKSSETVDNRCLGCQESNHPCKDPDSNQQPTSSSTAQSSDALHTTSNLSPFDTIISGALIPQLSQTRAPQMWYHPSTFQQNPLTGAWDQEVPKIDMPVVALPVDCLVFLLTASSITDAQKLFRNMLPAIGNKFLGQSPVKSVRFPDSQPTRPPQQGTNNGHESEALGELRKSHPTNKRKSTDMKDDDKLKKTQPVKKSKPSFNNDNHKFRTTIVGPEIDAVLQMAMDQAMAERLQEQENAEFEKESFRRCDEDLVISRRLRDQYDVENSDSTSSYEVMSDSEMFGTPRKKNRQKEVPSQQLFCINCNSPFSPVDESPACPVHTGSLIGSVAPNSDTLEPISNSGKELSKERRWDCCNTLAGSLGCKWVKHEASRKELALSANALKDQPSSAQSPVSKIPQRAPRRAALGQALDFFKGNAVAKSSFSKSKELLTIPQAMMGVFKTTPKENTLKGNALNENNSSLGSTRLLKLAAEDFGLFKSAPDDRSTPAHSGLVSSNIPLSSLTQISASSDGNPVEESYPRRSGLVSYAPRLSPSGKPKHYPKYSPEVTTSSQVQLPPIRSLLDPSDGNPPTQLHSSQARLKEVRQNPFDKPGMIKIPIKSGLPDISKCALCGEDFNVKLNFKSDQGPCISHQGTKVPKGNIWNEVPELKPSEFVDDPDWGLYFRWSCCDKISTNSKCNPHVHHLT